MMNAVELKGLTFSYPGKPPVLRELELSVRQGEIMTIAGLSGCGKTTLAHIICGIIPHLIKGDLQGSVSLFGQDTRSLPVAKLAETAALVFQDSDEQMICTTVEDELAFGPENLALAPAEIGERVHTEAAVCGLSGLLLRDPGTLSGGQKKLVALASVLTLTPRLIIFDEPLSGLDEKGRMLVAAQLRKLRSAGKTVLVIEHDLDAADAAIADRWLILAEGMIAACDTPQRLRESRLLYELELRYDD